MLKNVFLVSLPILMSVAPTFAADSIRVKGASNTVKAYEIGQDASFVLNFPVGESQLTAAHKAQIEAAVKINPPVADKIRQVVVAAYADQGYPLNGKESLSPRERNLASERGKKVAAELERAGTTKVKIYNMAEKASWFEKTFVTKDAQLKREASVDAKDIDPEDAFYQLIGGHLGQVGGASKVVVTVVFQPDRLSH